MVVMVVVLLLRRIASASSRIPTVSSHLPRTQMIDVSIERKTQTCDDLKNKRDKNNRAFSLI